MLHVKDEPIEMDDLNSLFSSSKTLHNLEDILRNTFSDIEFNIHEEKMVSNYTSHQLISNNNNGNKFSLENVFDKIKSTNNTIPPPPPTNRKFPQQQQQKSNKNIRPTFVKSQHQHQQLHQPIPQQQQQSTLLVQNENHAKEAQFTINCDYDWLKIEEEDVILKKLNEILDNQKTIVASKNDDLYRYRCKLRLRKLKRSKRLKCFDIDTYTNELIDTEMNLKSVTAAATSISQPTATSTLNNTPISSNQVLPSSASTDDIIAINHRVLDRFDSPKKRKTQNHTSRHVDDGFDSLAIVEYRNEDVKCIFSPCTNKILKPYIRRESESWPARLQLHKELYEKCTKLVGFERHSIDYVYLRPEHVLAINNLCHKYFWNGIDVSECLQYPDYTCVVLYRKLIIGFAFLVPNVSLKEDYLSFIFVHPHWRHANIATYMLYRLTQVNLSHDIVLHVSVSSPAVLFYQKFGFKIEEYIKQFYDKYYSDEDSIVMSKDAFLMRMTR